MTNKEIRNKYDKAIEYMVASEAYVAEAEKLLHELRNEDIDTFFDISHNVTMIRYKFKNFKDIWEKEFSIVNMAKNLQKKKEKKWIDTKRY